MGAITQKSDSRAERKNTFFVWVFVAGLALSLLIHALFLRQAESWVMKGFSAGEYDQIVPRTFHMERVEIDPKTLEMPKETDPVPKPREVTPIPDPEKPVIAEKNEDIMAKALLSKPKESEIVDNAPTKSGGMKSLGLESEMPKTGGLEIPVTESPATNLGKVDLEGMEKGNDAGTGKTASYSSLDELLAGTGQVTSRTAPILMPTDLLFEYDSAQLRPDAATALEKLGTLITRNAGSSFRIEGHTDSFGSDQYNEGLSLRRAEAVKDWLAGTMKIDPARISTAGLGKGHLLVPGTGTVAEQQLNRRVEIVILQAKP
jgi:outer membrane protein OmpA-like peptidoglycan-associated protein